MSLIEFTPLPGFRWEPGKAARIWFVQPRLQIQAAPPFVSIKHKSEPTGLELLKATLVEEGSNYDEPGEAPCFILLPEFAIAPSEIHEARELVAHARKNTVVIFGTGQITESKARAIEPTADLWDGPSNGKFTNCAAIGIGSLNQLYLQPKIIPSKWEHGSHWPGKKVRYFEGQAAHFIVLICSELLFQAAGQTTIASVVRELQNNNRVLNEVIWLQHNQFPRSSEFDQSLAALKMYEPQILVVSSRSNRPERIDNFSVSGAIVPQRALSSGFDVLDGHYRYVEPLSQTANLQMSRIVLLRYDADVYRVRTVLPAYLQKTDGAAKGGLFRDCDPYSWDSGNLRPSPDNFHLQDLVLPARKLAKQQFPGVDIQIDTIADHIVAAGTLEFLGLLDVANLPRYPYEHAAGQPHKNGDYLCRCWPHRECIDSVGHAEDSIESMAIVIESAAVILKSGILVRPKFDRNGRTNFVVNTRGQQATIGIVDAVDKNATGVERALSANKTIINGSPYLVRRTSGPARPSINSVNASQPAPLGQLNPSTTTGPRLKAIFEPDYQEALSKGTLEALIYERLVA